ncbi:MAG: DUF4114 domain-containing protein [Planctomycetota bacterium]
MRSATIVILLAAGSQTTAADAVRHFGPGGGFGDVPQLLDSVGIGRNNAGSETTANSFRVPGQAGTTTDLTFSLVRDTGGFNFSFAYFDMAAVSADPLTNRNAFATQALANAQLVFDDRTSNPGAVSSAFSVNAGSVLGFLIMPNSTIDAFNANPDAFLADPNGVQNPRAPLFSMSDANPGQMDQMLSFVGNGVTLFTFEDLVRTGDSDQDFTDVGFTIDVELQGLEAPIVPTPTSAAMGVAGLGGLASRRRR